MKNRLSNLAAAFLGKKTACPPQAPSADQEGARRTAEEAFISFWDEMEEAAYQIALTDIQAVSRQYRHTIDDALFIGFSSSMDICVNYDKSVSRRHCEILREGDCFYIVNHSQSNGTFLNCRQVVDKTPVFDGDIITMGRVEMRLEIDG